MGLAFITTPTTTLLGPRVCLRGTVAAFEHRWAKRAHTIHMIVADLVTKKWETRPKNL